MRRAGVVTVALAAATLGVGTAQASATPAPDTITNGILSITPACQGTVDELIKACTRLETPTPNYPVMLDVNPVTTHLVVLGAGLTEDGQIQPVLTQRLEATLATAQHYPTAPIIVTGGVPKKGITEASAMKKWLTDRGVPAERITEEPESSSTVENAAFTNDVLHQRGATGAVLVTNRDHIERAMINFRQSVDARIPVAGIVAD
ncbi:YdcF family protein [Rhodococcus sp. HNM0569]|nr:YdcF family protein [Rhodococcus sp. HNM0569]NLU82718.1 YdcF family protein [Rhodococcus sp. HNM0569]